MNKKLLSILLTLSMVATMMLLPQAASAANPWKTIMNKTFSTSDDLAILSAKTGEGAGFVNGLLALSHDSENGCLKAASGTRFDVTFGKHMSYPNVIRFSFDAKLDDTANYYFEIWALENKDNGIAIHFTDFGGEAIKRNEWQKYTIELTPGADNTKPHTVKCWRGDEQNYSSAYQKTYQHSNKNYTYITWLRFAQKTAPSTEVYFDNFKLEQFMYLPEVKGVSFIDHLGNEITDLADMTPAVSKVKLNIENAASVDEILANFWIFNETKEEEVELSDATYENGVFTAVLPNGLKGGCDYSINVDSALANANGETGDGAYITFNTVYAQMQAELKVTSDNAYANDKWKTTWTKDFSSSGDFALDDSNFNSSSSKIPGFVKGLNSLKYDEATQSMRTTTAGTPRFDVGLGGIVAMPDRLRYSFDVKLDNEADFYVNIFGLEMTTNDTFRFTEFGGEPIKRNEWQRYTMEIIPNNITNTAQHVKIWRGDESYYTSAVDKVYQFNDTRYNYAHWVRVTQRNTASENVYFDNFKLERRRYIFASDFSENSYGIVAKTLEPSGVPGFNVLNGTVTNAQQFKVDASKGNTELMRVWLAGMYPNARPVKFSFDLKTDDENLINLLIRFGANTDDVSGNYVVNGDDTVGGAAFHPGAWQRYNFVIVPAAAAGGNYTITAWRGGASDRAKAVETTFVMPKERTNISNISLINGVGADVEYYIDNVVAERFPEDNFEVENSQITEVTATIDNSAAVEGNYWLVLAGYARNVFDKISIKPITVTKTDSLVTETISVPEDMAGCDNVKAYLWDSATLAPLTEYIEVR